MKLAIMFSGQGSQYPNMGIDLLTLDKNKDKIELANKIFGFDCLEAIKNNNDELSNTKYTQSLITLVSILIYDELINLGLNVDGYIGFSLGEIVALYASNIYSYSDILEIIKFRSLAMEEASNKNPGKMAAIINFDEDTINNVCNEINKSHLVCIANYNSKKQVVISGSIQGVDLAIEKLKELGARRIIVLNVSGAFHTKYMSNAGLLLNEYASKFKTNKNIKPLYLNSSTNVIDYLNVSNELEKQIQSPVYFYQSIERMINDGFNCFIEVGPGNVLANLVSKNYNELKVFNIENLDDIEKLKGGIIL